VIDLHCHMLPGIDDGARNLSVSLEMAKASVDQGIEVTACTPHILPGLYHNSGPAIRQATLDLQAALDAEGLPLRLVAGADVHMCPDFVAGLQSGRLLTLGDTRYVLVEPPHHTAPPQLEEFFFNLVVAGYVPILTHPERNPLVMRRPELLHRWVMRGCLVQVTAKSYTGGFGSKAQRSAEWWLGQNLIHFFASDAHDVKHRPPILSACYQKLAEARGEEVAELLLTKNQAAVIHGKPLPPGLEPVPPETTKRKRGWFSFLRG